MSMSDTLVAIFGNRFRHLSSRSRTIVTTAESEVKSYETVSARIVEMGENNDFFLADI